MSSVALRESVAAVVNGRKPSHIGLLLERYVPAVDAPKAYDKRNMVLDAVRARHEGLTLYRKAYVRWLGFLEADSEFTETVIFRLDSRLFIGLGGASALEFGVSLHHTYGYPMIPGAGVKGLCAAYADAFGGEWAAGERNHAALFGAPKTEDRPDTAGAVDFLDAWWVPFKEGEEHPNPFKADVVTCHHPGYYTGKGGEEYAPPLDSDAPVPVSLVSVTGGFCFAVRGPKEWRDLAMEILRRALAEWGIGGKTRAGYGRFTDPLAEFRHILNANARNPARVMDRLLGDIRKQEDEGLRKRMAGMVLAVHGPETLRRARRDKKAWFVFLDAIAEEGA